MNNTNNLYRQQMLENLEKNLQPHNFHYQRFKML